jgi:hypothetical protein
LTRPSAAPTVSGTFDWWRVWGDAGGRGQGRPQMRCPAQPSLLRVSAVLARSYGRGV